MKYLTKGELLLTLGNSANNFTAFMLHPEQFGVVEPVLTMIHVAKQKLDWANTIDITLPEVLQLVQLLIQYGIVSKEDGERVLNTPDRSDADIYLITVKAQDDITMTNIYGAIWDGNQWKIVVEYYNKTKDTTVVEDNFFSEIPNKEQIQNLVTNRITELKRMS